MTDLVVEGDGLRRMFAGLCEHTFAAELGVADPPLIDYLAGLLERFVRMDAIFRVRDAVGKRLDQVGEMLLEADAREANPKRELHRHIGDFTLFWSGVYPEFLKRLRANGQVDALVDYPTEGKRNYRIASELDSGDDRSADAPVLRRLSYEFDLCQHGLSRVRQLWNDAA